MSSMSIARAIAAEERILAGCADLLRRKRPLAEWPPEERAALMGALADEACRNEPEAYKARTLRAHLFRRLDVMPGLAAHALNPAAEMVRADLIRLVPLGAGCYLLKNEPADR